MNHKLLCSVIVTTYNWPKALKAVIQALLEQTIQNFEIIIADDGSSSDTAILIQNLQQKSNIPLIHVWQEDEGFRVSRIRNLSIKKSTTDYIIFIDGDCIVKPNFIENHLKLQKENHFVTGNRVLLSKDFTQKILNHETPINHWSMFDWVKAYFKRDINRLLPLLPLPLYRFRKGLSHNWKGAKGCNLAVWKTDLYKVAGWDESFTGWGYEDSDLIIRLYRTGMKRLKGNGLIPVIHLWHKENDRSNKAKNLALLKIIEKENRIKAISGLNLSSS
ncbi:MAG: glycosyl transferase family 2 [Francisellaceae bacterium]|nr:glycosyl transferase family 2 [Francisellaceae bacterium]